MGKFALFKLVGQCGHGARWRTYCLCAVRIRRPVFPDHGHIVGDAMKLECCHIELFLLGASELLLLSALATVYLICLACDACACFFWKFLGRIPGARYGGEVLYCLTKGSADRIHHLQGRVGV
jgi:hypothetical protein